MKSEIEKFEKEREQNIADLGNDKDLVKQGMDFVHDTAKNKYTYNFSWLGRPIIQFPQDMIAIQEIIWNLKPDLIIETGIAHGGSLILSASILELVGKGEVLGIDIDIRDYNKESIESHPLSKRISMLEGSSVSPEIVDQVYAFAKDKETVMVILDSNHTHEHVYEELKAYSKLVSKNSYLIVFDTSVEFMPEDFDWGIRSWGKGNNPHTAVTQFLKENDAFVIDKQFQNKLLITVAPDGYLKRVK